MPCVSEGSTEACAENPERLSGKLLPHASHSKKFELLSGRNLPYARIGADKHIVEHSADHWFRCLGNNAALFTVACCGLKLRIANLPSEAPEC